MSGDVLMRIGVPDVLGNPNTVGHLDSDYRAGLIDYVIDAIE